MQFVALQVSTSLLPLQSNFVFLLLHSSTNKRMKQWYCIWHIFMQSWGCLWASSLSWKTPCSLQKENLTLLIKTSTTQRWNTTLVIHPHALLLLFFISLCITFSTSCSPFASILSLKCLTRTFPLFDLSFFLPVFSCPAITRGAERPEQQ